MQEYVVRVKATQDGYAATIRQHKPTPHPDVRMIVGQAGTGHGKTAPAAMLAAIINARIETV